MRFTAHLLTTRFRQIDLNVLVKVLQENGWSADLLGADKPSDAPAIMVDDHLVLVTPMDVAMPPMAVNPLREKAEWIWAEEEEPSDVTEAKAHAIVSVESDDEESQSKFKACQILAGVVAALITCLENTTLAVIWCGTFIRPISFFKDQINKHKAEQYLAGYMCDFLIIESHTNQYSNFAAVTRGMEKLVGYELFYPFSDEVDHKTARFELISLAGFEAQQPGIFKSQETTTLEAGAIRSMAINLRQVEHVMLTVI
ncbi:MAG: hypothetical protein Alpg2KO_10980 [Alphaproteobacteria bacterium]